MADHQQKHNDRSKEEKAAFLELPSGEAWHVVLQGQEIASMAQQRNKCVPQHIFFHSPAHACQFYIDNRTLPRLRIVAGAVFMKPTSKSEFTEVR